MFATQNNLILLAQSPELPALPNGTKNSKKATIVMEPASNWTIYNLKIAQADVLYKDFMEQAADHAIDFTEPLEACDSDKIKIYALLLSEAHTILRIANEVVFDSGGMRPMPEDGTNLEQLFLSSCQELADFYVMSTNRDQYCLAYPYYSMGRMPIDRVYNRIVALTQHVQLEADAMKGAVHTLKRMIVKTMEPTELVERRLTQCLDGQQSFGDRLLEFFVKYAPHEIATLALSSTTFRELMSTKIANAISSMKHDEQL